MRIASIALVYLAWTCQGRRVQSSAKRLNYHAAYDKPNSEQTIHASAPDNADSRRAGVSQKTTSLDALLFALHPSPVGPHRVVAQTPANPRILAGKMFKDGNDESHGVIVPSVKEMIRGAREGAWQITGVTGNWKEVAGNYICTPVDCNDKRPLGIIHFLGGAFVGATPHHAYRYLLDSLCHHGYIVVATPYHLKFDYLNACSTILSKFDSARSDITATFGNLPVIGIGHSCGALLHTYITSLVPDESRAANVLISFNNKPATSAIPGFDDVVVPISKRVMGPAGKTFRNIVNMARNGYSDSLEALRSSPLTTRLYKEEVVPAAQHSIEIVDQIPEILASIANGTREYFPTPQSTRKLIRNNYRVNRTLVIQFGNDGLDESATIAQTIRKACADENCTIDLRKLKGTHNTPLTQNVLLQWHLNGKLVHDPLTPIRQNWRKNFLKQIDKVDTEITQWLAER